MKDQKIPGQSEKISVADEIRSLQGEPIEYPGKTQILDPFAQASYAIVEIYVEDPKQRKYTL